MKDILSKAYLFSRPDADESGVPESDRPQILENKGFLRTLQVRKNLRGSPVRNIRDAEGPRRPVGVGFRPTGAKRRLQVQILSHRLLGRGSRKSFKIRVSGGFLFIDGTGKIPPD